jgi:hypothetical protein
MQERGKVGAEGEKEQRHDEGEHGNTKTLSENEDFVENELSTSQMKKCQIVLDFLLPTDQKPAGAIEPGMRAFHDPATLPPATVFWF